MAQHKFGTCRRAMLSFERQPFPAPCHVDQDVAHSRAWRALGHLTTFDRVLPVLHRRNHLPYPRTLCIRPILPRASRCGQHHFAPGVHFGADSDLCATAYIAGAAGPHSMRRATAAGFRVISKARSTSPTTEKGRGLAPWRGTLLPWMSEPSPPSVRYVTNVT